MRHPKYLKHVRTHHCMVCFRTPVDAHHFGPGGMGLKSNDYFTVPLCREHHNEFHRRGQIGDMSPKETKAEFYKQGMRILVDFLEKG